MSFYRIISFLVLCLQFHDSLSLQSSLDALRDTIDSYINAEKQAHIGLKIISLKAGECLYQKDSDKLFVPASNVKLFTAAAALALLGKEYTFQTCLATDGKIKRHNLYGNLFIKGSGDPSLTIDNLENLVLELKSKGITAIRGTIIVDTAPFDEIPFGPGWAWDDGPAFYNSPVSSININHNCVKVRITGGTTPTVTLEPQTAYVKVNNLATSIVDSAPSTLQVKRRWLTRENTLDITGQLPKNTEEKAYQFTIEDPLTYTATLLRELLAKHKICFTGTCTKGEMAAQARILAIHHSKPLSELLKFMMKNSDNLYAECLFKKLGSCTLGNPGSWQKGKEALTNFIEQELGIPRTTWNIVDGSGLSRYNLCAPEHLITLLKWVLNKPFASEFIASLPISGSDGSLQTRMIDPIVQTKVKAKTGSLGGITALSGYITTQDNELLIFAMLTNGLIKPSAKDCKILEDALCTCLAQFSRKQTTEEHATAFA